MTILKWIVKCDNCGKEIDATKEHFVMRDDYEHLCLKCDGEV